MKDLTTRQSTTLLSKVNLHHAIDVRAVWNDEMAQTSLGIPGERNPRSAQGYLAHKNTQPPKTLQKNHA